MAPGSLSRADLTEWRNGGGGSSCSPFIAISITPTWWQHEAYRAGTALAYVGRPRFPESQVLAQWVEEHMIAAKIGEDALRDGAWLAAAGELLQVSRREPDEPNGAVQAAEVILERFPFIKE